MRMQPTDSHTQPGGYHSLPDLLDEVRREYFPEDLEATIIWGRAPRRRRRRKRRSIVFASWWEDSRLIRVHPALDRPWVPAEFLRYLIYHELCHAIARPKRGQGGKRRIHHPEFRALENQYPDIDRMRRLSRELLERIAQEELKAFSVGPRLRFR